MELFTPKWKPGNTPLLTRYEQPQKTSLCQKMKVEWSDGKHAVHERCLFFVEMPFTIEHVHLAHVERDRVR